ncbi:bile acid:sodium symporter family protein [Pseudomonas sp. Marseille-Q5117]|uniref:bile acid:sodium symporter family protein n=1 Tax=Pseudomonas sp. Marseille-Q5117 TaxID=2972777 RepID=UPI0021CA846D|nr:bile acid:sodium symporter family protein [Pseudomonas sp. Marseille-Q5117]
MRAIIILSKFLGNTFAYWVLIFAVLSYLMPQWFIFLKPAIIPLLGLVMFGMGLTLKIEDFSEVIRHPGRVALGVIAHFIIMPGVAWLLCQVFHLPAEIAIGVILVGCCPSGTSSNVMAWLAKGDLALAVAIAAVTTLVAPILTPALIWLLASAYLSVSFIDMLYSILQMVMLPIILGVMAQKIMGRRIDVAIDILPLISVVSIVMIVAAVVSNSQSKIAESGLVIIVVVIIHNTFGFLLGYFTAKLFKLPLAQRKSLSLEVGMQNSGLGAALASAHFSPIAAVPSALFSVWHNISGALLSTYFRKMKEDSHSDVKPGENGSTNKILQ